MLCSIDLAFPNQSLLSQYPGTAWVSCCSWFDGFDLGRGRDFACMNSAVPNCFPSDLIYLLSYSPWGMGFLILLHMVGKFLLLLGSLPASGGAANLLFLSFRLLFAWPRATVASFSCAPGRSKLTNLFYQAVTNAVEYDLNLQMQWWVLGASHFHVVDLHLFKLGTCASRYKNVLVRLGFCLTLLCWLTKYDKSYMFYGLYYYSYYQVLG